MCHKKIFSIGHVSPSSTKCEQQCFEKCEEILLKIWFQICFSHTIFVKRFRGSFGMLGQKCPKSRWCVNVSKCIVWLFAKALRKLEPSRNGRLVSVRVLGGKKAKPSTQGLSGGITNKIVCIDSGRRWFERRFFIGCKVCLVCPLAKLNPSVLCLAFPFLSRFLMEWNRPPKSPQAPQHTHKNKLLVPSKSDFPKKIQKSQKRDLYGLSQIPHT